MALSPSSLQVLSEQEEALAADLESQIDREILRIGPRDFYQLVDYRYPHEISQKVANALGRIFEGAGWVVTAGRHSIRLRIKPDNFIGKPVYLRET